MGLTPTQDNGIFKDTEGLELRRDDGAFPGRTESAGVERGRGGLGGGVRRI